MNVGYEALKRCMECKYKALDVDYEPCKSCMTDDLYWSRISDVYKNQRLKGIATYGQILEDFKVPEAIDRLIYIEEELVDALMYIEWLKDKLEEVKKNEET